MNKIINVTKSSMPDFDEYCAEIEELWGSHWLTNKGIKHQQLELLLKEFLNCESISLFTNGHLALENVIASMNLSGEVITTPFTFVSTTNAIIRNGLTPVFCDINKDDYTIDVNKIEKLITNKTSAIIPVHVYGNICDFKTIDKIAKKYNLKVIYDAAHAFGESIENINVANLGDASMFSFHATKVFNTIEGGAVAYKDSALREKINIATNFGINEKGELVSAQGNAKMNEFQASMGICNLRHLDIEIQKRKMVYNRYISNLCNKKGIRLNYYKEGITPNYSYFPVLFDPNIVNRDTIFDKLKENNIIARKYFYPLTSEVCRKDQDDCQDIAVAKYVSDNILCLPMYADLDMETVDIICDIILNNI